MESLDSSFTIEVNGTPISKLSGTADEPVQAKVGSEAAIFTLKDGRLQCGDRVLGRSKTEDRSMRPKPVFWFPAVTSKDKVRPVTAKQEGSSLQLMFGGSALTETDGEVFADLMQEGESTVNVKIQ
ncbi:hypothetical protein K458DRAFT_389605 [Lentithecium fluviatile CBS 122367]|uniref:Uncharacterized protein n=1 Tax=Lentithecium fluviatile CBS 122367 TaxID=1168545 RepID=A0A6G1IZK1_9PLEO|nr:hypothetical protein K458DRAFT_389605 [Lentithecium fluviatile CBS 122367]